MRALSDRFRCVAWDMPGYGASAPLAGRVTFNDLPDTVSRLIKRLGGDPAHVVGLSLGGMIALNVLEHPDLVRSLSLLDTSPAFGLDGTDPDAWRRLRLDPLDAGQTPSDMSVDVIRSITAGGTPDAVIEEAAAAMARIPPDGLRAAVECLPTHDLSRRLGEIATPTLVVVGEHDAETPPGYARRLAEDIGDARLEIVAGARHLTNLERPEPTNHLLSDFFGSVDAPA